LARSTLRSSGGVSLDETKLGVEMRAFDPGYGSEPFAALCRDYPGEETYPPDDFRVEWGPVFHRGRLDGTARVLVVGQDPGVHEGVVRRILVGEAGQRAQGLLSRLGIERSYVMVNAFLYSVYGQGGGERHVDDQAIADYRHRWLDALLDGSAVEAVIAFGHLADQAFRHWLDTPAGRSRRLAYAHLTHPTRPEAVSRGDRARYADAMRAMLVNWNKGLDLLFPVVGGADLPVDLAQYGDTLQPEDLTAIPAEDLPAGLPAWMGALDAFASRGGDTPDKKRATIVLTVPRRARPWL
jgi:uracil-DNA glycosylase